MALGLAVLCLLVGSYFLGVYLTLNSSGSLTERERALTRQLEESRKYNMELQREMAELTVGSKVDQASIENVQDQVTKLEFELADSKDEIAFYQAYLDPKKRQKGVMIGDWEVAELNAAQRRYRYKLVIQRKDLGASTINLRSAVKIIGTDTQTKKTRSIPLNEVLVGGESIPSKEFEFKYFQLLRGEIKLPGNFKPQEVEISLQTAGRKAQVKRHIWALND